MRRGIPGKLAFVLLVTIASAGVYAILLAATGQRSPLADRTKATIMVPNAFQLIPKADVRQAGVKIGEISSVDYQVVEGGVVSKLGVSLNPAYKIYRDARVQVRTKTLANENYIDLRPGDPSSGALGQGDTLPLRRAEKTVQLDDLFGTLDPATRQRVRENLDEVGGGLEGHGGDLNEIIAAARPLGGNGREVLGTLAGQRDELGQLVHDTSELFGAFASRTESVRSLATQARQTAEAAASRDTQLANAIRVLPGTLTQARTTLASLGDFSGRSAPVVRQLASVTRDATPLLRDLEPAARATRKLVGELPTSLRRARPLLAQLKPFSARLRPAVTAVDATLRQANPLLEYLAPYSKEIGVFFAANGSAIGQTDAAGNIGRVYPILSPSSYSGLPNELKQGYDILTAAGVAGRSGQERINPIPKPGTNGNVQPFDGNYPRLTARMTPSG